MFTTSYSLSFGESRFGNTNNSSMSNSEPIYDDNHSQEQEDDNIYVDEDGDIQLKLKPSTSKKNLPVNVSIQNHNGVSNLEIFARQQSGAFDDYFMVSMFESGGVFVFDVCEHYSITLPLLTKQAILSYKSSDEHICNIYRFSPTEGLQTKTGYNRQWEELANHILEDHLDSCKGFLKIYYDQWGDACKYPTTRPNFDIFLKSHVKKNPHYSQETFDGSLKLLCKTMSLQIFNNKKEEKKSGNQKTVSADKLPIVALRLSWINHFEATKRSPPYPFAFACTQIADPIVQPSHNIARRLFCDTFGEKSCSLSYHVYEDKEIPENGFIYDHAKYTELIKEDHASNLIFSERSVTELNLIHLIKRRLFFWGFYERYRCDFSHSSRNVFRGITAYEGRINVQIFVDELLRSICLVNIVKLNKLAKASKSLYLRITTNPYYQCYIYNIHFRAKFLNLDFSEQSLVAFSQKKALIILKLQDNQLDNVQQDDFKISKTPIPLRSIDWYQWLCIYSFKTIKGMVEVAIKQETVAREMDARQSLTFAAHIFINPFITRNEDIGVRQNQQNPSRESMMCNENIADLHKLQQQRKSIDELKNQETRQIMIRQKLFQNSIDEQMLLTPKNIKKSSILIFENPSDKKSNLFPQTSAYFEKDKNKTPLIHRSQELNMWLFKGQKSNLK